jgi:hypothetical protein
MQAAYELALSAASGKRAMSSDALSIPVDLRIRQSLPVGNIGQSNYAYPTECPDFRKMKNA